MERGAQARRAGQTTCSELAPPSPILKPGADDQAEGPRADSGREHHVLAIAAEARRDHVGIALRADQSVAVEQVANVGLDGERLQVEARPEIDGCIATKVDWVPERRSVSAAETSFLACLAVDVAAHVSAKPVAEIPPIVCRERARQARNVRKVISCKAPREVGSAATGRIASKPRIGQSEGRTQINA